MCACVGGGGGGLWGSRRGKSVVVNNEGGVVHKNIKGPWHNQNPFNSPHPLLPSDSFKPWFVRWTIFISWRLQLPWKFEGLRAEKTRENFTSKVEWWRFIHGFRKLKITTCKRAGYQWRCSTCCEAEWKGLGRSIESRCTSLRAGLARRLVVMVTDVGIVPFLYCLRQSLFNAVVLGIYSNILLGLGPLRKQFLATYIKDLFLGKMLRSNKSRKWMNHGKPVCVIRMT